MLQRIVPLKTVVIRKQVLVGVVEPMTITMKARNNGAPTDKGDYEWMYSVENDAGLTLCKSNSREIAFRIFTCLCNARFKL